VLYNFVKSGSAMKGDTYSFSAVSAAALKHWFATIKDGRHFEIN